MFIGEVQIQAFVSILYNQIQWGNEMEQIQQRDLNDKFLVRQQPVYIEEAKSRFMAEINRDLNNYQGVLDNCLTRCLSITQSIFSQALASYQRRWDSQIDQHKQREIISPNNLRWSKKRVETRYAIIRKSPYQWIGQHFRPLLVLEPAPFWQNDSPQNQQLFQVWEMEMRMGKGLGDYIERPKLDSVGPTKKDTLSKEDKEKILECLYPYDLSLMMKDLNSPNQSADPLYSDTDSNDEEE